MAPRVVLSASKEVGLDMSKGGHGQRCTGTRGQDSGGPGRFFHGVEMDPSIQKRPAAWGDAAGRNVTIGVGGRLRSQTILPATAESPAQFASKGPAVLASGCSRGFPRLMVEHDKDDPLIAVGADGLDRDDTRARLQPAPQRAEVVRHLTLGRAPANPGPSIVRV